MDGGTPLWSVGKCITVYLHDFCGSVFQLNLYGFVHLYE